MLEQNKTLTRRFYDEVFGRKNLNVVDELCAAGMIDHNPMPGQAAGTQGIKDTIAGFLKAFPDMSVTVHDIIAERDLVAVRLTMQGTHTGSLMGETPTGKKVSFRGLDMVRIKDGKAIEVWHEGDDAVVLMQLGVQMPAST